MNSRQQHILFSHLYLCEGLVVAADVEQAVILRNQPTKTEKKVVSTCKTNGVKYIFIFHFSASNRKQKSEMTPLPTLLSLHSLIKKKKKRKKKNQRRDEGLFKAILTLWDNTDGVLKVLDVCVCVCVNAIPQARVLFQTDLLITHPLQTCRDFQMSHKQPAPYRKCF